MEYGIFTVGDVTTDPTTGRTPSEHERIRATVDIAVKAEEIGLDVFATTTRRSRPRRTRRCCCRTSRRRRSGSSSPRRPR